jgi:hypothetical protein
VTLSLQLWNLTGAALEVTHEATWVLGNSIILQRAMSEPAGKKQNSAAQPLMPHELTHEQNRVAIVKSVITKIFNPSKYWMVTIQPF